MKIIRSLKGRIIIFTTAFLSVIAIASFNAEADTTAVSTKSVVLNTAELKVNKVIVAPKKEVVTSRVKTQNSSFNISRGSTSSNEVVNYAYNFLGKPYVYGASGPNAFDCSGLTSYVFRQLGVNLPRTSSSQFGVGMKVSRENLQPGDLVFFNTYSSISHVGIYIGGGEFIHASSTGKPVMISNLNEGYYNSRYAGARRVM